MARKLVSLVLAAMLLMGLMSFAAAEDYPDLEVWTNNNGYLAVEKDGALYNFYKELTGVGMTQPYVEWNGGTTYQEQLNLRIAANEMPDIFIPVNGMETELIKAGAILDLTDLLPEKAPHLWAAIPEAVWDVVKANDPTGQGRIYYIPSVLTFARSGGIIRADWLENLGMESSSRCCAPSATRTPTATARRMKSPPAAALKPAGWTTCSVCTVWRPGKDILSGICTTAS